MVTSAKLPAETRKGQHAMELSGDFLGSGLIEDAVLPSGRHTKTDSFFQAHPDRHI